MSKCLFQETRSYLDNKLLKQMKINFVGSFLKNIVNVLIYRDFLFIFYIVPKYYMYVHV